MNINYISERLSSIRQEIRDLRDLNTRYWSRDEHSQIDKSAYQSRQIRLTQIKQELAVMMKRSS